MKEYKKPAMLALSLSANDRLCACTDKTKDDAIWLMFDADGNGIFDQTDVDFVGYFGGNGDCSYEITVKCKFTSTSDTIFVS